MAVSPATGPTEHEIKNNAELKTTLTWKKQLKEMEPKIDDLMKRMKHMEEKLRLSGQNVDINNIH